MKICIVIDSIDKFDSARVILDTVCSLGDEAEVYSLFVSKPSLIIPVSLKKVHSSFFTKIYRSSFKLYKNSIFSEQVAKRVKLPDADKYLIISEGFSHQIPLPKNKKALYYFLDLPKHLLINKFSKEALLKRYKKSLQSLEYKSFSSHAVARSLAPELETYDVIAAPFKSRDFPQVVSRIDSQDIVINLDREDDFEFEKIIEKVGTENLVILTNQKLQKKIASQYPDITCLTSVSTQELFIQLTHSKLFIECSRRYPEKSFAALASGIPVMIHESNRGSEYFTDDVSISFNNSNFFDKFSQFDNGKIQFKPDILRRFSLRFNERVFKNKVWQILSAI